MDLGHPKFHMSQKQYWIVKLANTFGLRSKIIYWYVKYSSLSLRIESSELHLHAKYSPKKTNPSMQHAWKTEVKKKVKSWSSRLRDKEDTLLNKAIYTNPKFVTKQDARSLYSCFRVSLLQSQYFISSWLHTIFFTHFCDALNLRADNSQSLSS